MHICQTWCTSSSLNPGWIRHPVAKRTIRWNQTCPAGREPMRFIDDADAATNRGLATVAKEDSASAVVAFWRPSKGKPRTEVVLSQL